MEGKAGREDEKKLVEVGLALSLFAMGRITVQNEVYREQDSSRR
jgi:hypothetical protein